MTWRPPAGIIRSGGPDLSRFRLRYQGTDLELAPGEFVIGRSSACNLALDDALVSRRHAMITVGETSVLVEDLGSRNGILVNGHKAEGRTLVRHLDRITVGSHELVLVELKDASAGAPTLVGVTLRDLPSIPRDTVPGGLEGTTSDELTGAQVMLTGIADKALALQRYEEAERVLVKLLDPLLERARSGAVVSAARLDECTRYALRLAEGTRKHSWLDWVFDAHAATGTLIGEAEIERLHELVRKLRYAGGAHVRKYLDRLRARASDLKPRERFLLSRLEGIERVVSA